MTDGSRPPHGVSTLRKEYFDLKTSDDGTIIHGVFVRIESATGGPSVDVTYMVSNREAKSILTKLRLVTAPPRGGTGTGWKRVIPRVRSSAS